MKGPEKTRINDQKYLVDTINGIFNQHNELSQTAAKERSLDHRKRVKETSSSSSTSRQQDVSLTYGEVTASEFMNLLSTYHRLSTSYPVPGGGGGGVPKSDTLVFVDLGSGRGLPSICAALSPILHFSSVWGIEIVPELVSISLQLRDRVIQQVTTGQKVEKPRLAKAKNQDNKPLIDHIVSHIINNVGASQAISLEMLADVLCKQLGHKVYRDKLKGYKTLRRYLQTFPERLALSEDDELVSVVQEGIQESLCSEEDTPSSVEAEVATSTVEVTSATPTTSAPAVSASLLTLPTIHFECADIFVVEWWKTADVVYAASLLFSEDMMLTLAARVLMMRPGTWFISLKPLPLSKEEEQCVILRHDSFFRMSWQMAKVYFYQVFHPLSSTSPTTSS
eukprot:gene7310-8089_t